MTHGAFSLARRAIVPAAIGIWLLCGAQAGAASLTSRDVQIIAKALGFLDPAPAGGTVAVVYAAGNTTSKADADGIVALFGAGIASGGGTVTARAVDAGSLHDGAGFIAIILAAGAEEIGAGAHHGLLSISATDALVQSGHCVMAVHSEPKVDITVNRSAAQAAGVGFTAAFGMLVHEL